MDTSVDPGELFRCRGGTALTAQLTASTRPPPTTVGAQLPIFLLLKTESNPPQ